MEGFTSAFKNPGTKTMMVVEKGRGICPCPKAPPPYSRLPPGHLTAAPAGLLTVPRTQADLRDLILAGMLFPDVCRALPRLSTDLCPIPTSHWGPPLPIYQVSPPSPVTRPSTSTCTLYVCLFIYFSFRSRECQLQAGRGWVDFALCCIYSS